MLKFTKGFIVGVSVIAISGIIYLCNDLLKERDELLKSLNGPYQPFIKEDGYLDKNRKA